MYQQIVNWKDGTYTLFLSKKLNIFDKDDVVLALSDVDAEDIGQLLGGN